MHKAVSLHRNLSATSDVSSRSDADSATWSPVAHRTHIPCTLGPNSTSSRPPRPPVEYKQTGLSSNELAYRSFLRTGSFPMGNAFTRESATRYEDRDDQHEMSVEASEDESDDEDMDATGRNVEESSGSEDETDDADGNSKPNESRYSDDDASETDESDNDEYEDHRPRAAVSDVRNNPSSSAPPNPRDNHNREREPPSWKYTPNVLPSLPSVRILRPSPASFSSSRLLGPGATGTPDPEYKPNPPIKSSSRKPAAAEKPKATSARVIKQPARPRENAAKRKREETASEGEACPKPAKAPRPRKGGNGGQSGFKRKEYKCDLCPNFYAGSKGDLKRHLESRLHKEPSYVCMVPPCEKVFTREDALKRHMKNAHNHPPNDPDAETSKSGSPEGNEWVILTAPV